ncbi:MAG: L,D-transpeptidase family protein [Brevinematales bacterium]|nr:L,D-transpeptidase family protein [Brevinematales bacterium]
MKCFLLFVVLFAYGIYIELINGLNENEHLKKSSQAILVLGNDITNKDAKVYLAEKEENKWRLLSTNFNATIGKNGFARVGEKKEGDGKTPSGIFKVGFTFGYADKADTKMPYRQATTNDFWVDDVSSPLYNQWVRGKPEAKSMEKMRRSDHLYKWGIVVEYNMSPIIPGKGSAIFVHVWRKPFSPTTGSISLSEEDILYIFKWLEPGKNPVVVMGTKEELTKLKE